MTKQLKEIEIPFGAKDSELKGWEYTIPEGMEAEIKDGKIIVREKESKDEKIRKDIVTYLTQSANSATLKVNAQKFNKWIAWLKKQGEQKLVKKYNITGIGSKNAQGKLGEMIKNLKLVNEVFEQKPTWSEKDEKMLSDIGDCIKNLPIFYESLNINGEDKTTERFVCDAINWLKSIKDRVQPQNLTVTDEELAQAKKNAYNDALDKIEYNSENPTFDDGWSAAIWYLKKKNVQPQNTWKPSDEQMYNLSEAAHYNCAFFDMEILKGLYDDLKKVREE